MEKGSINHATNVQYNNNVTVIAAQSSQKLFLFLMQLIVTRLISSVCTFTGISCKYINCNILVCLGKIIFFCRNRQRVPMGKHRPECQFRRIGIFLLHFFLISFFLLHCRSIVSVQPRFRGNDSTCVLQPLFYRTDFSCIYFS